MGYTGSVATRRLALAVRIGDLAQAAPCRRSTARRSGAGRARERRLRARWRRPPAGSGRGCAVGEALRLNSSVLARAVRRRSTGPEFRFQRIDLRHVFGSCFSTRSLRLPKARQETIEHGGPTSMEREAGEPGTSRPRPKNRRLNGRPAIGTGPERKTVWEPGAGISNAARRAGRERTGGGSAARRSSRRQWVQGAAVQPHLEVHVGPGGAPVEPTWPPSGRTWTRSPPARRCASCGRSGSCSRCRDRFRSHCRNRTLAVEGDHASATAWMSNPPARPRRCRCGTPAPLNGSGRPPK